MPRLLIALVVGYTIGAATVATVQSAYAAQPLPRYVYEVECGWERVTDIANRRAKDGWRLVATQNGCGHFERQVK